MDSKAGIILHRSKDRIREMGEVFTPETYVDEMLDLMAKDKRGLWGNDNVVFFEPTCGHGNFVVAIYKRRLSAFYKKVLSNNSAESALYAVANSINTLWAVDIDFKNVNHCRERILELTVQFLLEKTGFSNVQSLIKKHTDFFTHLLCATSWHIHENEMISSLSNDDISILQASKTKFGKKWHHKNGHHPIEFDLSWVDYFENCESNDLVPLDFEKSERFIKNAISGNSRGLNNFTFAKCLTQKENIVTHKRSRENELVSGF